MKKLRHMDKHANLIPWSRKVEFVIESEVDIDLHRTEAYEGVGDDDHSIL
jgi:hypothetical protein